MADRTQQPVYLPTFFQSNSHYFSLHDDYDTRPDILKPSVSHIVKSKRIRTTAGALVLVIILTCIFRHEFYIPSYTAFRKSQFGQISSVVVGGSGVDWSQYAYTQYVTNEAYLCNSVMIFEALHRLGSKAERLMMYPNSMDIGSRNEASQLLRKAQNDYVVKLMPIEVQHRSGGDSTWADSYTKLLAFNQTQYKRVLSLDSDSTILQHMDELFLLPPSTVAMPRAYWLEQPFLSSQLILIEPSTEEFSRIQNATQTAKDGDFDMEIVNNLYDKDCMIIPHRRYDLITGEFRTKRKHDNYLGNGYEVWDPEAIVKEAKFLHFSDWPVPKPWVDGSEIIMTKNQPECHNAGNGTEDCRARDLWLGFYSDFKERRNNVCKIESSLKELTARSVEGQAPTPLDIQPS